MVFYSTRSLQKLSETMEWKVVRKNISSSLLLLLLPSTIFILIFFKSSVPFITTDNQQSFHDHNPSFKSSITHSDENINTTMLPNITSDKIKAPLCDVSVGKWIRDPIGSIYTNSSCPTMPDLDNCVKHGKDSGYIYWRWKPAGCEIPRFDPWLFLEFVCGKKMAFIGDSLARNQVESLLCLLSKAEIPEEVYRDENDKYKTWYFPAHNFTVMVMWTEFLVDAPRKIINGSPAFELRLDKMNSNWTDKLPGLDYVVLNGGNWFFRRIFMYEGENLLGCIYCRDENVTKLDYKYGIRRTLRAALEFINNCQYCDGLVTIVRTYSPSHFENGSWFNGGYCRRTQPMSEDDPVVLHGEASDVRSIQLEEFEKAKMAAAVEKKKKKLKVLDVTKAIMLRADGHRGELWNRKSMKNSSDCLHWCLPGPIDMWNDLLLAALQRD